MSRFWIPLLLLTDYMSPFNFLIHTSIISTEKRLKSAIAAWLQAFDRRNITYMGWLLSGNDLADYFY